MRLMVWSVVVLTVVGCQGPKGDPGPAGPAGPAGMNGSNGTNGTNGMNGNTPDGGVTPTATNCSPTQAFCEGNRLWYCTKSGADAYGGADCSNSYGSTATNPYVCTTTGCPAGNNGACCAPTKQLCSWNTTGAVVSSGPTSPPTTGESCSGPPATVPGCPSVFSAGFSLIHSSMCPPSWNQVAVGIQRASVTAGQTVTLPNAAVTVTLTNLYDNTKACGAWTGTVTFDADVPAWKVSFNVTCSEAGKTAITLDGSIQGNS